MRNGSDKRSPGGPSSSADDANERGFHSTGFLPRRVQERTPDDVEPEAVHQREGSGRGERVESVRIRTLPVWLNPCDRLLFELPGRQGYDPVYHDTGPVGPRTILGRPVERSPMDEWCPPGTGGSEVRLHRIKMVRLPRTEGAVGVPNHQVAIGPTCCVCAHQPPQSSVLKDCVVDCGDSPEQGGHFPPPPWPF